MMFGGGMLFGWLIPLILLILGGAWLFNTTAGNRVNDPGTPGQTSGPTAEEILKQRFARGEISREEYESMREALRQ